MYSMKKFYSSTVESKNFYQNIFLNPSVQSVESQGDAIFVSKM